MVSKMWAVMWAFSGCSGVDPVARNMVLGLRYFSFRLLSPSTWRQKATDTVNILKLRPATAQWWLRMHLFAVALTLMPDRMQLCLDAAVPLQLKVDCQLRSKLTG